MDKKIEVGAVVELKSGSTTMTVESVSGSEATDTAGCTWFDEGHAIHHANIKLAALKLVEG